MTITLLQDIDDPEYESAKKIYDCLAKDESLKNNPLNNVYIIPSVQCYGQLPQDIDVVIIGFLEDYQTRVEAKVYKEEHGLELSDVKIRDFCCAIEVKKHSSDKIEIIGTKVYVTTQGKKRAVTHQNRNQRYSLRDYLINHIKTNPWLSNLIYFPFSNSNDFGELPTDINLLFKDFTVPDFWKIILSQRYPLRRYDSSELVYSAGLDGDSFQICKDLLTKRLALTRLDKEKVKKICQEIIKDQKYGEKLHKQLLVFRGRGGTGKTFRLLRIAHQLYKERLERVLILTYNLALISDIRRLFAQMRIKDDVDESIQIMSLTSYWYKLFYATGIRTKEDFEHGIYGGSIDIPKEYTSKLKHLIESKPELKRNLMLDRPDLLDWDYIMIDEAQDWPAGERDLIYSLFQPKNVIVADGYDQLIRGGDPCNWTKPRIVKDKQVIPLRRSMRQKSNIVQFLMEFTKKINIDDLDLEKQEELYGGRIIILFGDYTEQFHEELVKSNKQDKNENVDMLFCVPPELVDRNSKRSTLSNTLKEWGYPIWDGTIQKVKKQSFPTEVDQLRIVQYDSCRGLEGWITVIFEFDTFYNYKLETFEDVSVQKDLRDYEERRKDYAKNWLLIPLTRAMDTLVIQIKDANSEMGKILSKIAKNNPEYIEVRT